MLDAIDIRHAESRSRVVDSALPLSWNASPWHQRKYLMSRCDLAVHSQQASKQERPEVTSNAPLLPLQSTHPHTHTHTHPYTSNMAPAWLEKFIVRTDATPDARRTSDTPVLLIHYTALAAHRRILGVEGDTIPRYQVDRHAILGAWGDKCSITAPAQGGKEIAVLDFHTIPSNYTAISLVQRGREIRVPGRDPAVEASGGLGRLRWKDTGMQAYGAASWELRDERDMVLAVSVDGAQANGEIG